MTREPSDIVRQDDRTVSPIASITGEQSASEEPKRPGEISRRVAIVGIAAVLVVALALRFYGLSWDEGFSWTPHPDERAILMNVGELGFPSLGDLEVLWEADESPWNPGWFPYGSFPLYLLKAVQSSGGFLLGARIEDLRTPGRAVSALADIATIALVYLLGAATSSRRTGLIAAGLVALAVLHIQLSHFFAVDTLLALSAVATAYFLVRVARDGRTTDSALAGVFIGLGLATKISIAPILASYLIAHLVFASGMSLSKDRRPASASGESRKLWAAPRLARPSFSPFSSSPNRMRCWTGLASMRTSSNSPRWSAGSGTIRTRGSTSTLRRTFTRSAS